ncbi:MAG: YceH family protein [Acidobacteriaceae bacterium]
MVNLSAVEARVLGVLMEKEINTPEYYPLSLNATVNACNQKSSREPVMELSEAEVRTALFELDQLGLVRTIAESRATKFEHRVREGLGEPGLRRDEVAVICLLSLRGAQTSAELRARTERMYAWDDAAAVLSVLERLAGREEPLVQLMARQAGEREARWVHLVSGPVDVGVGAAEVRGGAETRVREAGHAATGLAARVEALEEVVRGLEERLRLLESEGSGGGELG